MQSNILAGNAAGEKDKWQSVEREEKSMHQGQFFQMPCKYINKDVKMQILSCFFRACKGIRSVSLYTRF